jgi:hypothetical protein
MRLDRQREPELSKVSTVPFDAQTYVGGPKGCLILIQEPDSGSGRGIGTPAVSSAQSHDGRGQSRLKSHLDRACRPLGDHSQIGHGRLIFPQSQADHPGQQPCPMCTGYLTVTLEDHG